METKICNCCHEEKSLNEFSNSKISKDGKCYQCKACDSKHCKEYYWKHKEERLLAGKKYNKENPDRYRSSRYKLRYGITIEEYDDILDSQNGVCAICFGKEPRYKYLVVDHDHKTGNVRGIICSKCNDALGRVGDNIETLLNMAEYLKRAAQLTATVKE